MAAAREESRVPAISLAGRPLAGGCDTPPVTVRPAYMEREGKVVGLQLAKAGHRLAALLNHIWP